MFDEDGQPVEPGSGQQGMVAVGGPIPIGYYKDPEKTAATFRTIGGRRWSVPGDWATVEADGTHRAAGPGLGVHQQRGGEDLSRRSGRGGQGPPRGGRLPGGRGA